MTGVPVPWTVCVLGAAMIVYTVRGGSAAVIWTDVVQMFIYIAGALVVFVALLNQIPGGFGEVVRLGTAAGKFTVLDLSFNPKTIYTLWAGVAGGIALTLATHGTDQFLVQRLLSADSPKVGGARARAERLHRLRAVHAVPADRRDALRLSPALSADRGAARATTPSCRASSSITCRTG